MANEVKILIKAENLAKGAFDDVKTSAEGASGPLNVLTGHLGAIAAGAGAAGLVMAGGKFLEGAADRATEVAGEVSKMQRIIGGSAQDASRLRFAFEEAGIGADQADNAMRKFSKGMEGLIENEDGTTTKSSALVTKLKDLGITTEDASGKQLGMNQVLTQVADKFKEMPNGAEKTALAVQMFGKSGTDLLPFLNKGAEGIAELEKQSDKLGLTIGQSTLDQVKKATIAHREMNAAIDGVKVQIGIALIPVMTAAAEGMAKLAIGINETVMPAIHQFSDFIKTQWGPSFQQITTQIQAVIDWVQAHWGEITHDLQGPLEIAISAIKGLLLAQKDFFQTTLTAIGDILAIFADLFQGKWGKLWQDVKSLFTDTWGNIKTAFSDQFNAIRGVVDGAATTLNTAFGGMMDKIKTAVSDALKGVLKFFKDLPGDILDAIKELPGDMEKAGEDAIKGMLDGLKKAAEDIPGLMKDIGNKVIHSLPGQSPWPGMETQGEDAIQGLINGMQAKLDAAVAQAKSVAQGAIDGIKAIFGSSGENVKPLGQLLGQGLIDGIEASKASVQSAIDDLQQTIDQRLDAAGTDWQTHAQRAGSFFGSGFDASPANAPGMILGNGLKPLTTGPTFSGANGVLTPEQLAQGLLAAGFPADSQKLATMVAILLAENGGRTTGYSSAGAFGFGQLMPGFAGISEAARTGQDPASIAAQFQAVVRGYSQAGWGGPGFGPWNPWDYQIVNGQVVYAGPGKGTFNNFTSLAQPAAQAALAAVSGGGSGGAGSTAGRSAGGSPVATEPTQQTVAHAAQDTAAATRDTAHAAQQTATNTDKAASAIHSLIAQTETDRTTSGLPPKPPGPGQIVGTLGEQGQAQAQAATDRFTAAVNAAAAAAQRLVPPTTAATTAQSMLAARAALDTQGLVDLGTAASQAVGATTQAADSHRIFSGQAALATQGLVDLAAASGRAAQAQATAQQQSVAIATSIANAGVSATTSLNNMTQAVGRGIVTTNEMTAALQHYLNATQAATPTPASSSSSGVGGAAVGGAGPTKDGGSVGETGAGITGMLVRGPDGILRTLVSISAGNTGQVPPPPAPVVQTTINLDSKPIAMVVTQSMSISQLRRGGIL